MSSMVEKARERLEEVRTKGARATLEEKFPKIKEMRGGGMLRSGGSSGGNNPEVPALKDIREKGVLGVLGERFPKVKEMRERGILARITPKGEAPAAAPEVRPPAPTLYPAVAEAPVRVDLKMKPRLY
ncbi:MAG: hypothetical protein D4S01_10595 [Dehalococcoidia bacterium]|nr:MAG: hypothetical protein D4S01_10595 [Dehalococcoidia bacterium]